MGCHILLQGISPTQGSNPCLLLLQHWQTDSLPLHHLGSPYVPSVQFSSVAQSYLTLCNPLNRSTPGLPVHHQLPEFTQIHIIESVMPSSHLILCRPLFLLPPIPPSIRVFSNESTVYMRWPEYWGFSFSIIPSKEHPGLISIRMNWLDLLAIQGTLQSPHQFFGAQLSLQSNSHIHT